MLNIHWEKAVPSLYFNQTLYTNTNYLMRALQTVHDPVFQKKTHNVIDRFFLPYIRDERDLPFIYLCIKLTFIIIPIAIILFTPLFSGWYWWMVAAVYAGLVLYFAGPYTLMLHNTSHRKLFKKEYNLGNHYIPWVLAPFMGQTPETYFSHHLGMHHLENNLHDDKSSTMKYQRDSFTDFCKYFLSFLFLGVAELAIYFKRKNLHKLFKMVVRGETLYIIFVIILGFINLQATLYVLILPLVIVRFSMMSGNWGQHAFIDPETPANNYRNSITCINHFYNRHCFNDGYHIGHHLKPNLHWTEMPVDFQQNQHLYAKENAVVFEGLDYMGVWFNLMFKRYDNLASHFVNIGDRFQSKEEIIKMLKYRTKRIE